jgi:hypothetical protein
MRSGSKDEGIQSADVWKGRGRMLRSVYKLVFKSDTPTLVQFDDSHVCNRSPEPATCD